jgi:hypothetical protein
MNETISPVGPSRGLVDRAKAMILTPRTEWPVVAAEADSVSNVLIKYVVPIAAISPVAMLIGSQVFGYGAFGFTYRPSLGTALASAITSYVLTIAGVFLVAFIANFLSPRFGGKDSYTAAFKWCAYAFTAAWVVGIVNLVPALSILTLLGLYSLYVLYLGATPMMGVPQDKAAGYTVVTVIATIVVYIVVGALASSLAPMWTPTATIADVSSGDPANVELNLGEYGQLKVTDNGGGNQTIELPGIGKIEMSQDGDTVRINADGLNAE